MKSHGAGAQPEAGWSYWNAGIGELRLSSLATGPIECTVYTAQGVRVGGQRFVGSTTLHLHDNSPGVFVVDFRSGEQRQTLRLIRE